jgi:hypothetical protein
MPNGPPGAWYNVWAMDSGVEMRHAHGALPPVPPRSRRLERRIAGTKPRLRPTRALFLLIAVVLALAGLSVWLALPGPSTGPTVSDSAIAAGTREVRLATEAVTQAGTAMSSQMSSLRGLPTVASVSAAVDPYLVALEHYRAALSSSVVNRAADQWRRVVLVEVHTLVTLLASLPTTPSGQLGSWINNFYLQTAELQSAIQALGGALPQGPAS